MFLLPCEANNLKSHNNLHKFDNNVLQFEIYFEIK